MATYWVSQAKHWCDFCKVWISDNKSTRDFHAAGKKHKENVETRIGTLKKKGQTQYNEQKQYEKDMQKMEKAALMAFRKDMKENPDVAKQYHLTAVLNNEETVKAEVDEEKRMAGEQEKRKARVWHEAKSEDGSTYYWHIYNGQSVWEPPGMGYLSIKDQKLMKEYETKPDKIADNQKPSTSDKQVSKPKTDKQVSKPKTDKQVSKHKTKPSAKKKDDSDDSDSNSEAVEFGPTPKAHQYGTWQQVPERSDEYMDLQLPTTKKVIAPVTSYHEDVEFTFKEKTAATSSSSATTVSFKKRKHGGGDGRSIRHRGDDD